MVHIVDVQASTPAVRKGILPDSQEVSAAKVGLAACLRMAGRCHRHAGMEADLAAAVPAYANVFLVTGLLNALYLRWRVMIPAGHSFYARIDENN